MYSTLVLVVLSLALQATVSTALPKSYYTVVAENEHVMTSLDEEKMSEDKLLALQTNEIRPPHEGHDAYPPIYEKEVPTTTGKPMTTKKTVGTTTTKKAPATTTTKKVPAPTTTKKVPAPTTTKMAPAPTTTKKVVPVTTTTKKAPSTTTTTTTTPKPSTTTRHADFQNDEAPRSTWDYMWDFVKHVGSWIMKKLFGI